MSAKERKVVIAGNWKMHHGYQETEDFFLKFAEIWKDSLSKAAAEPIKQGRLEVRIYPPLLSSIPALRILSDKNIPVSIGVQNVHWEDSGAYTGEVSAPMLKEIGILSALVGHSERRLYFGETDETAHQRSRKLLDAGFHVIHCIGESLEEREAGKTEDVLARQLKNEIEEDFLGERFVLAYEPVWAIGTGKTATPEQAQEAHAFIRSFLGERFGTEKAAELSILYGGSVKADNLQALLDQKDIDGALIGGASLKPESFAELVRIGANAASNRAQARLSEDSEPLPPSSAS